MPHIGAIEPPISRIVILAFFVDRRKLPLPDVFLFVVDDVDGNVDVLAFFVPDSGNFMVNIFVPIVGTEWDTLVIEPAD